MEKVGKLTFGGRIINVYASLEQPLFRASEIADLIEYSDGNTWRLLELCEADEKLNLPIVVSGQKRTVSFVTETGLYNILSQSRKQIARAWRRIIHNELIRLRRSRGYDVVAQFDEWDQELETLYFDEDTGTLMQSVTVQGGDVIQVPYDPEPKEEEQN